MKRHLFYTLLVIFAITSLITLLGVTGIIHIVDGYLWPLVGAFLIELAGAILAVFRRAEFFDDPSEKHVPIGFIPIPQHESEVARIKSEHAAEIYRIKNPPPRTADEIIAEMAKRVHRE